ncbi:5-oxoprolinase subunit PxpB [Flavobacteriaceae bacterium]|nr:5-oxoprolinase subunit PxpB [Flavobacteriaceae bacterium]
MFVIKPFGEAAVLIQFKNEVSETVHLQVKAMYQYLKGIAINGVVGFIPAYCSLTVKFDVNVLTIETLITLLENISISDLKFEKSEKNIVKIPVCYDAIFGLDLKIVQQHSGLTKEEIIRLHTAKPYLVYMLGFVPGFMYLGGLDAKLVVPRKETPRLKINAGAVGLADMQTGVYPLEIPGGWQIIGQTPLTLFDTDKGNLVQMGDYIQFEAISVAEFHKIKNNEC